MALFLHKEAPFNGDLFLGRSLNPPFRGDGQKHPSTHYFFITHDVILLSFYFYTILIYSNILIIPLGILICNKYDTIKI